MSVNFPLKLRKAFWPPKAGRCGMCGGVIGDSVVYFNAGATADCERSKIIDQEAFCHCGIHTANPDGRGNVDVTIVEAPNQDQFELSFCSSKCLKDFFLAIVREVDLQKKRWSRRSK